MKILTQTLTVKNHFHILKLGKLQKIYSYVDINIIGENLFSSVDINIIGENLFSSVDSIANGETLFSYVDTSANGENLFSSVDTRILWSKLTDDELDEIF